MRIARVAWWQNGGEGSGRRSGAEIGGGVENHGVRVLNNGGNLEGIEEPAGLDFGHRHCSASSATGRHPLSRRGLASPSHSQSVEVIRCKNGSKSLCRDHPITTSAIALQALMNKVLLLVVVIITVTSTCLAGKFYYRNIGNCCDGSMSIMEPFIVPNVTCGNAEYKIDDYNT
ncbi:Glucosidase 2 subunit beta [Spatholobus suberectus]|nr:Glucosidase 2 subunit beta [Spatholobus suberectus]